VLHMHPSSPSHPPFSLNKLILMKKWSLMSHKRGAMHTFTFINFNLIVILKMT